MLLLPLFGVEIADVATGPGPPTIDDNDDNDESGDIDESDDSGDIDVIGDDGEIGIFRLFIGCIC